MAKWPLFLVFCAQCLGGFGQESTFFDIQLQGEITGNPVYLKDYGLLVSTDDRRAHLVDPKKGTYVSWDLPRIPKGQPSASKLGLMAIPLSDGRLALLNPRGGLVRIQASPESGRGFWFIDDVGRIYWALGTKIIVLSTQGKLMARFTAEKEVAGVLDDGFFAGSLDSPILLGPKGQVRQAVDQGQRVEGIVFQSNQSGYQVEINTNDEHFSYKAQAQLSGSLVDPYAGIVAWGDERWKLLVKPLLKPLATKKANLAGAVSVTDDEREFKALLQFGAFDGKGLKEFFLSYLDRPEYYDWVESKLLGIILGDFSLGDLRVDEPDIFAALVDLFSQFASLHTGSFLGERLYIYPDEAYRLIPILKNLGIDGDGNIIKGLAKLIERKRIDSDLKKRILDLVSQIEPTVPQVDRFLLYQVYTSLGNY